jgi:hypothetical protein
VAHNGDFAVCAKAVPVCDEDRLQVYTAARYGSAHDSDWISPVVVNRVKEGLAS